MALTFVQATNRFFGKKPGQSTAEFAAELKDVDQKAREDLAVLLTKELGEEVVVPPPPQTKNE